MTDTSNGWGRGCLVVVGVNHHAASLEVRERLAMDASTWRDLAPAAAPSVLLSTCNRVEVYAWAGGGGLRVARALKRSLARAAGLPLAALEPHLFVYTDAAALLHLVRVAAGLDSLVVGEEQIRGQVRRAFAEAAATTPLPAPLAGIFHRALYAARRVRVDTPLGHHPSVATAGVEVALHTPEVASAAGTRPPRALLLGAGVMAKSALDALLGAGAAVVVVNRTLAHAEALAARRGPAVTAASFEALPRLLPDADLVVCGTAARRPVVDAPLVATATAERRGRPLVILDVAVPRDVEPAVRGLAGVRLIDLDDLEGLCPVRAPERHAEATRVEALAAEEAQAIHRWLRLRAMGPTILALRAYGESVRAQELRRAAGRLRSLTPEQSSAVDELTERIVNKLLHGPTVALRETADQPRAGGRSRSLVQRVVGANRATRR